VRQDDVHPAELGESGVEDFLDLSKVAHVGLLGNDLSTGFLHQANGLVEVGYAGARIRSRGRLTTDVETDDVRTLTRQRQRVGAPLTASHSRDERDLPVKLPHVPGLLTNTHVPPVVCTSLSKSPACK